MLNRRSESKIVNDLTVILMNRQPEGREIRDESFLSPKTKSPEDGRC